jgi:hypothetical protein
MPLTSQQSLAATLEPLSENLFFRRKIPTAQRVSATECIARRQGLPGSYFGMFAPTALDAPGIRLFTGEIVRSRAGISHQLGEECCRVLALLDEKTPQVQAALDRARQGMAARLDEAEKEGTRIGTYCCGTCSAAYWRNLALGFFPRSEQRLKLGLQALKQQRKDGQWSRFPFYFTSLALVEIGPELAGEEMRYAASRWRKLIPRLLRSKDRYARRRAEIGRRLLELCET